jgi:hypothetical protein
LYERFEGIEGATNNLISINSPFAVDLSMNTHYVSMSRGVIDTRDVIYFIGLISIFILSTKTVIESRKW